MNPDASRSVSRSEGSPGEPESGEYPQIRVTLDAWVTDGADGTWLSPAEVVDAALADPEFAAYIEPQNLGNGQEEILWYRPEFDAWEVGLLFWHSPPQPTMHLVLVDPHTGDILDTVDRP